MTPVKAAILKTLVYADIFNYPLKSSEIHRWLISKTTISKTLLLKALKTTPHIGKSQGYYYLKSSKPSVLLRKKRTRYSRSKLVLANKAAQILKIIPFINIISLTGALAMNNSHKKDDIDLFIITKKNRLWLTRFLSVFLLELFRLRRRPSVSGLTQNNNKVCLNLFLDEITLSLAPSRRQLYTAHEVAQIKPLYEKSHTYHRFLAANSWVKSYLPHAFQTKVQPAKEIPALRRDVYPNVSEGRLDLIGSLNLLAYKLQHKYMKKKITHEQVTLNSAFFHPRPTSKIILNSYKNRLKAFKLS